MNVSYASAETNSLPFEVTFITNGLTRAATFVTKMQKNHTKKSQNISTSKPGSFRTSSVCGKLPKTLAMSV